jgi:hypothetical protein
MSAKVTLRIPEHVLERLRERSQAEGRSLNDTAVDTLLAGLGETAARQGWRDLGDLVATPPERPYDPAEFAPLREAVTVSAAGVMDALQWVRGEA